MNHLTRSLVKQINEVNKNTPGYVFIHDNKVSDKVSNGLPIDEEGFDIFDSVQSLGDLNLEESAGVTRLGYIVTIKDLSDLGIATLELLSDIALGSSVKRIIDKVLYDIQVLEGPEYWPRIIKGVPERNIGGMPLSAAVRLALEDPNNNVREAYIENYEGLKGIASKMESQPWIIDYEQYKQR